MRLIHAARATDDTAAVRNPDPDSRPGIRGTGEALQRERPLPFQTSKRSFTMTLVQAATKSSTNFVSPSAAA